MLQKNSHNTIQTTAGKIWGVDTFSVISPNMNVIVRLECELVYNDITVQHVSHYATGTIPFSINRKNKFFDIVIFLPSLNLLQLLLVAYSTICF